MNLKKNKVLVVGDSVYSHILLSIPAQQFILTTVRFSVP